MKFLEFTRTAKVLTDFYLALKPEESLLVVTDTRAQEFPGVEVLLEAVLASAHATGADSQVITFPARSMAGVEPSKVVATAMKCANVVILMTTYSVMQTLATTDALAAGSRVLMLPPARYVCNSPDMLFRLMPVDALEIQQRIEFAERLGSLFRKGQNVRLLSTKGTDLSVGIGKLKVSFNPNLVREKGQRTIVPGGQVTVGVNPGEADGKCVIDGSAAPMYRPLCENITLTIKEGKVTNIQGGGEAQEYRKILSDLRDHQVYLTAEVGVGFHPQAVLSGTPLEDERIFGAAWIGIGTNVHIGGSIKAKIHSDCVMLPPVTLSLDGRVLLKDRQFNV